MTTTLEPPTTVGPPSLRDEVVAQAPTTHTRLLDWMAEVADLTRPDAIRWVDGSPDDWAG